MATTARAPRRKGGGGIRNSLLFIISLVSGGEDWLSDRQQGSAGQLG